MRRFVSRIARENTKPGSVDEIIRIDLKKYAIRSYIQVFLPHVNLSPFNVVLIQHVLLLVG
jgi:hypothetical protein